MWNLVAAAFVSLLTATSEGMEMRRIPVATVTGIAGGSTALPCEVAHPPKDSIYLLLWFREPLTTPIYRLDERSQEEAHWWDERHLGTRASLDTSSSPALLHVSTLAKEDQGLYTCRVDFKIQPTKTTRVNLTVIVPPERVEIRVGDHLTQQGTASSMVGPYLEGDTMTLTCIARGGAPRPSVVWYEGSRLLDGSMESRAPPGNGAGEALGAPPFGGDPFNTVAFGPLSRSHLKAALACEAFNTNLTLPASSVVTVDMNLPPLGIRILPPKKLPLTAGREYQVLCVVVGARPSPTITWWSGHQRVLQATFSASEDKNATTSTVVLVPRPQDNGSFLRCIAETYSPPATVEDVWDLDVHYLPSASCSFGASLDPSNVKEGSDVYFECSIEANPRITRVLWRHNNDLLSHNVSAGVIISNQSLVLQRVVRAQAGLYSCNVHNLVGDATSNSLRLDIKYAPVCSPDQASTYAVGRYEDAEVNCTVEANPSLESFQWMFNNTADTIDVPQGRFASSGSHSVITYTPMTSLDYGTLLCWASNEIGPQREPCVFHIVPAGKPEPPVNCTASEGGRSAVRIKCVAGRSLGGGPRSQRFLLQARLEAGGHFLNLSSASSPDFYVEGLREGGKYHLAIEAANERGSSASTRLTITSIGTNRSVYQLHEGPLEAEVRDGGQTNADGESSGASEAPFESVVLPSFIAGVLGAGSGLVLIVILVLLFATFRRRSRRRRWLLQRREEEDGRRRRGEPPRLASQAAAAAAQGRYSPCLERDVQQAESESDAEPDVIPLQESCRGCERGSLPQAAVTLLPSHRYQYTPVPAHHLQATVCLPSCQGDRVRQHRRPQV